MHCAICTVTDYHFELATPDDDGAIRRILRENIMPGDVALTYEREPHFFLGCAVHGSFCQTLVGRQRSTGTVTGFVCRASRPYWLNGEVAELGYLSQLRIDAPYQGRWWLSAGFRALRRLHNDGRVRAYLATITEGNRVAEGILVKNPRPHYPLFSRLGTVWTVALFTSMKPPRPKNGLTIEWASDATAHELFNFYETHGKSYNLYPRLEQGDVGLPILEGLAQEEFVMVRREGEVVGVGAFWDQSGFKQSVVQGYQGWLKHARPLINFAGKAIHSTPLLPNAGDPIRFGYGAFMLTTHHDPDIYRALLDALLYRAWECGKAFLMVGMMSTDEYRSTIERYWHILYRSELYVVTWEDGMEMVEQFKNEIPLHIEIAIL